MRAGFALEQGTDVINGDLRRDFAVGVTAHAVGNHHQQGIARIAVGNSILIDLSGTNPTFLVDRELHRLTLSRRRRLSVVSQLSRGSLSGISAMLFCSANTLMGRSR